MVHHMNSYKTLGEKLDANYIRMLDAVSKKNLRISTLQNSSSTATYLTSDKPFTPAE